MATRVYHITAIENLPLILATGGLRCINDLRQDGTAYANIAHSHLQDRRATTPVPCGPGGYRHDYVPFYFAPRSPMLYTIHRGNVAGCSKSQKDIAYLVTSAELLRDNCDGFAFTDGHGIMKTTAFFDDLRHLKGRIDWQIMEAKYWRDTNEDPDRKRRRQAEFLAFKFVPWSIIDSVAVMRIKDVAAIRRTLYDAGHKTPVEWKAGWYY